MGQTHIDTTAWRRLGRHAWILGATAVFAAGAEHAAAQVGAGPHQTEVGDYTLIYSAVRSDALPDIMARRHGLPANSNAALLNLTVQRDGRNVRAEVRASATNLAQQTREIDMAESIESNFVSYIGVIEIADREVLDIELEVQPEGAASPIEVSFRQEFLPQPRSSEGL